jgi:diguanylate cyclase (GGDEF)-like protein/PAS domain S-box-containing protein
MLSTFHSAVSAGSRTWVRWTWRHAFAIRLASCFVFGATATVFVGFKAQNTLIWIANGLLLSYLLLAPRWRWPAYLLAGFAAQLLGSQFLYPVFATNLWIAALNIGAVYLSAHLLRQRSTQLPRFTDRAYLLRFVAFAVLAAPLASGAIFALFSNGWIHTAALPSFELWTICGSLGAAIATPAFVAIFRSRSGSAVDWRKNWYYPVLLCAIATAGFAQTKAPLLFLFYPLLLLVLMRMGLAWAAIGTLYAAAVGTRLTLAGLGPFAVINAAFPGEAGIRLQAFLAAGMFMAYSVSVVMERQKKTEQRLQEIVSLHSLVTENSRDVIMIADLAGNRKFVSPAMESITGWNPEELLKYETIDLVHPADRAKAAALVRSIRSGAEGGMLEVRFKKSNGDYLWAEASLRVVRDKATGSPTGILNIVRDISQRKVSEQSRDFHHSLVRAIHEVSLAGILVVNEDGNVVSINRRFADVWGVSTPETPVSLHDRVVASDEQLLAQCVQSTIDPEAFLKRVQELYANPDEDDHCEIELKDGRILERYSTGLQSDAGQYLGRVWFFTDITERKRAEQKLQDAYQMVEALSAIDSVTGLANRRRFDDYLALEWRRAMREGRPISLLLVDVDHFKSYNDTYGHLSGDSCLRKVAELALDSVKRAGDLVARFGGDEFTVILTDTAGDGALRVANDICASVRRGNISHEMNPRGFVTASVGCATMTPKPGQELTILIDLADRALYSAKRAGRDRASNGHETVSPEKAHI